MQTALFTKVLSDRSLKDACTVAADIGYDGVELMCRDPHFGVDTTDEEAAELRDHVAALGLEIPCLATYTGSYLDKSEDEREEQLDQLERFCELATILDVDLVRHGPGGPSSFEAEKSDYEEAAGWFRRAADLAAEYDKELGVEIHSSTIVESAADARYFLDMVDRENVGAIHDAGNMFISRSDYGAASVKMLGDWLRHVHVKDERRVAGDGDGRFTVRTVEGAEWFEPALLNEGDADHAPLFDALAAIDYDGFLTDECHVAPTDDRDPVAIARGEHETLDRLLSNAGR
ncbi:sugar phosphate isomerase/epimerase family protein [Haloarchaeobius sp. DFWS5]|uniref:sugar phosphate isomerase/epimerase family protein n=1 Tax=Haloarchaeobius sp. DFWS5 TaxID=3446114 RepID=UPI003EB860D0